MLGRAVCVTWQVAGGLYPLALPDLGRWDVAMLKAWGLALVPLKEAYKIVGGLQNLCGSFLGCIQVCSVG